MPAPGFPSQDPRKNRGNSVRSPVNGGLMDWMSWNFPEVFEEVERQKRDTRVDFKSTDYATQHPTQSGRTP